MTILILALAILSGFAVIYWLSKSREANWKKLKEEGLIWCEVVYQIGYDDFKTGRPQENWDGVIATVKNDLQKNILSCLKQAYQEGHQDAMDNLSSKAEQLRQLRNEQLDILKRMRTTLAHLRSSLA